MRRSWLQFSLRFLFVAMLAGALCAWWFRPGIVKPEFSLDGFFSLENQLLPDKEKVCAHIRLKNVGPDSIWLDGKSYSYHQDLRQPTEAAEHGWEDVARLSTYVGITSPRDRIRLRPGESRAFIAPVDNDATTIRLCVDLSDRRGRQQKKVESQKFTIQEVRLQRLAP